MLRIFLCLAIINVVVDRFGINRILRRRSRNRHKLAIELHRSEVQLFSNFQAHVDYVYSFYTRVYECRYPVDDYATPPKIIELLRVFIYLLLGS